MYNRSNINQHSESQPEARCSWGRRASFPVKHWAFALTSDASVKCHAPPHRQRNSLPRRLRRSPAVVDREVSMGPAKLTALEVPTTILVECEGQPLRQATPQSVEVAFVAQHPIRGCLPTHRQTLPREFVAQHPLRGCLPTHSHCRCQCGRA